jgi:hypothetical protein
MTQLCEDEENNDDLEQ